MSKDQNWLTYIIRFGVGAVPITLILLLLSSLFILLIVPRGSGIEEGIAQAEIFKIVLIVAISIGVLCGIYLIIGNSGRKAKNFIRFFSSCTKKMTKCMSKKCKQRRILCVIAPALLVIMIFGVFTLIECFQILSEVEGRKEISSVFVADEMSICGELPSGIKHQNLCEDEYWFAYAKKENNAEFCTFILNTGRQKTCFSELDK